MNRLQEVDGECPWAYRVSFVMQAGCTTWMTVKRLIYWGSGMSQGIEMGCGGVLRTLAVGPVVSGLRLVVQSGAEQEIWPSMMWQVQ
jgi:hypothetical protein